MKAALKSILGISLMFFLFSGCSVEEKAAPKGKENNLSLGASARDLLSQEKYTSLHLELVYAAGFEPSASAIQELTNFLQTHIYKPNGISISKIEIPSPGILSYKNTDLLEIEKLHRKNFNVGDEISVFILFTDGKSAAQTDSKLVLGTAYRNTSMIIYEEVIGDFAADSFGIPKSEIESTALKHEFGHLFGLVGNGSPVQSMHEDSENESHCTGSRCLMAAAVEFSSKSSKMMKSQVNAELDDSCLADLRANGGK